MQTGLISEKLVGGLACSAAVPAASARTVPVRVPLVLNPNLNLFLILFPRPVADDVRRL
jgi:hypothetical protein